MHRLAITGLFLVFGIFGNMGSPIPIFADEPGNDWVSKVISIQGRVIAKRQGQAGWQPVRLNHTLYAGDRIRVEANSRAGIRLSNDAVLRLDQNTTLVFTEIEKETTFIFKLLKGAANFFSRRPRSLRILTPFVNGVVEGTEFYVQVDQDQTRIDLFEGRIRAENPYGEILLAKGHSALAASGSAPQRRILVNPRQSVQWALYYPPVLALGPDEVPPEIQDALRSFNQGRPMEALDSMGQAAEDARDPAFYTVRAALLLHLGRVSQARGDLQYALALEPDNAEAMALQSIIAVVQNRKEEALKTARDAVQRKPSSAVARLALSYALQAAFNLGEALNATKIAVKQAPENGTVWARLAELWLSTGELDKGVRAAQKAVELNPHEAHAHTILGFAYLTRIKTEKARDAFEEAVTFDSAAPLPRLGLGLAKIREGDLVQGRTEIEIAAALDPANALIRSYLGKAYFDEKRGGLDEKQLEIAKTLDPNDPTPWYYDAIRKQTLNRPVEAFRDLQKSIELNGHRAIYRSRLLLDEDLAARSAGLGRIYNDLSFQELALRKGYKSLEVEPANYSAHRLLSDIYASRSRHEIARVSELLQSQLLQPINLTPVQPQLAETHLVFQEGAGPADSSFNEYNPLFARNRVALQASGVWGENDTWGDEITAAGVYQQLSISLGQFHYETQGFRENNDLEQDIYSGFAQVAISSRSSLQVEYRYKKTINGDLRFVFDPDDFSLVYDEKRENHFPRIGYHFKPNRNDDFLISVIANNATFIRQSESVLGTTAFGPAIAAVNINQKSEAYNGEVQHIHQGQSYNWILGAGYFEADDKGSESVLVTSGPYTLLDSDEDSDGDIQHKNFYSYLYISRFTNFLITLGLSASFYDDGDIDDQQTNPKVGLTWNCTPNTIIRAAAFRTFKRSLVSNQTLEPTYVAGFNQFFDDTTASDGKRYGLGIDHTMSPNVIFGGELTFRRLTDPEIDLDTGGIIKKDFDEQLHRLYLNWLPLSKISMSTEFVFERYRQDSDLPVLTLPNELTTQQIRMALSYFHPNGLFSKLKTRYIKQEIEQFTNGTTIEKDKDAFMLLDAEVGWRLPKRLGVISVTATNLLEAQFNFYGVDYYRSTQPVSNDIRPERQIVLRATFSF